MPNPDSTNTWADDALIRMRQITRIYQEGSLDVLALRGVDLDIAEGEFSALAGPSGSGKTTLLNIIGVLDHATSGQIEVAGKDVGRLSKGEAADFRLDQVGFIFQAFNLVPVLTAYENAEFTLLLRGVPISERKARVMPLLERVDQPVLEGHAPDPGVGSEGHVRSVAGPAKRRKDGPLRRSRGGAPRRTSSPRPARSRRG